MSLKETALIKGAGHYRFRVYTGPDYAVAFRGAKHINLFEGDIIGVRYSASGKDVRMVVPKLGPQYLNFVLSLPLSDQRHFSTYVRFLNKRERDANSLALVGGRFD